MSQLIQVNFQDGLFLPNGLLNRATYRCRILASVPDSWITDGKLNSQSQEKLLEYMYGPTWLLGNDDGSSYTVLWINSAPLTAEEIEAKIWLNAKTTKEIHYWFWRIDENGKVSDVKPDQM